MILVLFHIQVEIFFELCELLTIFLGVPMKKCEKGLGSRVVIVLARKLVGGHHELYDVNTK